MAEVRGDLWPHFHHAEDLVAVGDRVSFLTQEVADAFSVSGTPADIAAALRAAIDVARPDVAVVNPMPYPRPALSPARAGLRPVVHRARLAAGHLSPRRSQTATSAVRAA